MVKLPLRLPVDRLRRISMHGQAAQPADANPINEQFARGWWGEEPPYHTPVVVPLRARATRVSAAAPPCVNICARDSSMSCIWPCAPQLSARVRAAAG